MTKTTFLLALAAMTAGSSDASAGSGERFAAGTWHIESWMEGPQGSARGQPGATQTDTVRLSAVEARLPPATVFFTHFYHGVSNAAVRFENGRIAGSFEQPRVDDIAGHNVPISGTYARDRFTLSFTFRAFGMDIRHVVEGRLVAPPH